MQRSTPRHRRGDAWFGLGVITGLAVLAWAVITMQQLAADLHDANQARDALARQVQQLGGKPVAGPPGSRSEPGASVPGPPGPRGAPGPTGAPGRPGKDGSGGDTGAPGADGQTGPAGPRGERGPAGPAGPPGTDGTQGTRGPSGPAGPVCPDGYSLEPIPTAPGFTACHRDGDTPAPSGSAQGGLLPLAAGLSLTRRRYS